MQVKIKHPIHTNIMTFIDGQQINIKDHEGYAEFETAKKLINGPFGYEWAECPVPFNPETWTPKHKQLVWNMVMPYYEGYGYVGQMMIWALKQNGIDVSIYQKPDYSYFKSDIMDVINKEAPFDAWAMWHHFWMKPDIMPQQKKAMYTMWESTKLKDEWVKTLNSVNLVFVPCEQNRQAFISSGVTTPIKIIQHGVDQEFFYYRPKVKKDIFTFGTAGSLVPRKNPELLLKAFHDEFGDSTDVQLVLKDTNKDTVIEREWSKYANIKFNGNKVSPYEMGEILASFDIAIFPSRGEGFGLGGLQAMGVGTTCICTDWGGYKEYLNPEYNYALDYKLVKIQNFESNNTTYDGMWAEADYDHLRKLMRYAFEHRDEVHEKGKKAAKWVKDVWTWERCGKQLIQGIDEYEQNSR